MSRTKREYERDHPEEYEPDYPAAGYHVTVGELDVQRWMDYVRGILANYLRRFTTLQELKDHVIAEEMRAYGGRMPAVWHSRIHQACERVWAEIEAGATQFADRHTAAQRQRAG